MPGTVVKRRANMASKLVNGNIPATTACPFISTTEHGECKFYIQTVCPNLERLHGLPFSCAFARAFDSVLPITDAKVDEALGRS